MPVRRIYDDWEVLTTEKRYPNPFFDLSKNYIPKNIKTLFKYCRTFFYTNGFIRNVIGKMTEYPVTDILFDSVVDKETKEKYRQYWSEYMSLKAFLIEIGLDYFTFGNCLISCNMKFKRYLRCRSCKELLPIEQIDYKFRDFEFEATCPKCGKQTRFDIEDSPIRNEDGLKFIRWAPEQIDIDYDPYTGEADYYYAIDAEMKSGIRKGKKEVISKAPLLFIDAVKTNRKVKLSPGNLFHFKQPTLAEEGMGWGKPAVLPALKDIWYLQTLRRGNEAIATEHIVPKKAVFPQHTGTIDPMTMMNMGEWMGYIKDQIDKWRTDPNNIGVFPIPIGYQQLGGDAKALMLLPELKFIEETIINSLGVPVEFVKGGVSWSGSSISLRIVENHFLTYRELLLEFMNHFFVMKVHQHLGYPIVKLKFKKFKMADDTEAKQLLVNLSQMNKISDETLLDEFGYDYVDEKDKLEQTREFAAQMEAMTQRKLAEGQGEAQMILAKYQVRAQDAAMNEQHLLKEKLLEDELSTENAGTDVDIENLLKKYVAQISVLPPPAQQKVLMQMQKHQPITFALVMERLQAQMMQQFEQATPMREAEEGQQQMDQNQQKLQLEEKKLQQQQVQGKKDKHRAQTKGQP